MPTLEEFIEALLYGRDVTGGELPNRAQQADINRYAAQGYFYNDPVTGLPFQNAGYEPQMVDSPGFPIDTLIGSIMNQKSLPPKVTGWINPLDELLPEQLQNLPPNVLMSLLNTPTAGWESHGGLSTPGKMYGPDPEWIRMESPNMDWSARRTYIHEGTHDTDPALEESRQWRGFLDNFLLNVGLRERPYNSIFAESLTPQLKERLFNKYGAPHLWSEPEYLSVAMEESEGDPDEFRRLWGDRAFMAAREQLGQTQRIGTSNTDWNVDTPLQKLPSRSKYIKPRIMLPPPRLQPIRTKTALRNRL